MPASGDIDIVPNTAIDLEGGIQVTFADGFYRSGDYWLIPARTFVGDFIGDILWERDAANVPLALPPHGVERRICRLAVINVDDEELAGEPEDCRHTFTSLCRLRVAGGGCCTVTVGSGDGDFSTVNEALAALPEEGGTVCIRPGEYRERIVLNDPRNITIHGCGRDSRLVAPDGTDPVIEVNNGQDLTIRSLGIDALAATGISMRGPNLASVLLDELDIQCPKRKRRPRSTRDRYHAAAQYHPRRLASAWHGSGGRTSPSRVPPGREPLRRQQPGPRQPRRRCEHARRRHSDRRRFRACPPDRQPHRPRHGRRHHPWQRHAERRA